MDAAISLLVSNGMGWVATVRWIRGGGDAINDEKEMKSGVGDFNGFSQDAVLEWDGAFSTRIESVSVADMVVLYGLLQTATVKYS